MRTIKSFLSSPEISCFFVITCILNINLSTCEFIPRSEIAKKLLKYFQMFGPGQYWKDLPIDLQREALGRSFDLGGGKTGFLRRLSWDLPSPTLVTCPTMPATDLAHPEENRALSVG